MPGLDSYLVTLGVKGQSVVLSTMDKIRKKAGDLTKQKANVKLTAKQSATKAEKIAATGKEPKEPKEEKEEKEEKEKSEKKFGQSVDKFGQAAASVVQSAASLDPSSAISSGVTNAIGKIPGLGAIFATVTAATIGSAAKAVSISRETASKQYGLTQRNAGAAYYGGKVTQMGNWSNEESAAFKMTVGSAFGKINQPLADAINNLTSKGNFDMSALSRVAGGNWQSSGTDKGWMIQQLANSFQGLPPSIAQKFQAALLKNFGESEIQKVTPEQQKAQEINAKWNKQDEGQTERVTKALEKFEESIIEYSEKLKTAQTGLVISAAAIATAFNFAANQANRAGSAIARTVK